MHDVPPRGGDGADGTGPGSSAEMADLAERLRAALAPTYLLVRRLGAGGMGSVWLAREPALRRDVAVKVLAPSLVADDESRARFEREAQSVAAFSHPNVVGIHGLGALPDGTPYFVMQYVGGQSLADRIETEGPLPMPEVRRVVGEVGAALAAAHAKGIIHRDIKPANVLYDLESGRALVSDFGISAVSAADGAADARLTQTGAIIGTPKYMSPEALMAEPVTDRTDVYALGLLAYELARGEGPFQETTPHALIAAHLRDVPARLSTLRSDVDPEFDEVVASCLAKDPAARPTAAEVARRFAPGADAMLEWPPPGLEPYSGRLWTFAGDAGRASTLILLGTLAWILMDLIGVTIVTGGIGFIATMLVVLGSLWWMRAVGGLARDLLKLGPALHHGYSWLTIGEVASDPRRDTGALIAGGREYAGFDASTRARFRTRRVAAALYIAGAAVATPPTILAITMLTGGQHTSLWWPVGFLLAVPGALMVGSAALMDGERKRTAQGRRRIEARHREAEHFGRLVGPWHERFDLVSGTSGLGRGRPGRRRTARLVAVGLVIATLTLSFSLVPLAFIGYGSALPRGMRFNEATSAKRYLTVVNLLSHWGPSIDPTITAATAGDAAWTLAGVVIRPTAMTEGLRPFAEFAALDGLPADGTQATRGLIGWSVSYNSPKFIRLDTTLVRDALRGELPFTQGWLDSLDAHPLWGLWSTISRAAAIDGIQARVDDAAFAENPFEPPGEVWVDRAADRAAQLNHARVANLLARGRPRQAFEALREEVGFWRAQATEAYPSILPFMAGRSMDRAMRIGLFILEETRTGTPAELSQLRSDLEASRALLDSRIPTDTLPSNPFDRFAMHSQNLRDESIPIAERYRALGFVSWERCRTFRGALFGGDAQTAALFAYARDSIARWPSEVAFVNWLERLAPRDLLPSSILPDAVGVCAVSALVRP